MTLANPTPRPLHRRLRRSTARLALAALVLAGAPLAAEEMRADIIHAEMRGGWRTEAGNQMAALHLTLAPGWKTYWRAPGDAGIPPRFDWAGSQNIASATIHWPRPDIFDINGLRTIGYQGDLILPVEFTPLRRGAPMTVTGRVDLGVCEDICVPMVLDLAADLPQSTRPDPVIRAALALVPGTASSAGMSAVHCTAEPIRDGLRLTTAITIPRLGPDEFAVVEVADPSIWVSSTENHRDGGQIVSVAELVPIDAQPFALDRSGVRVTLFGGSGQVVDLQGCTG